MASDKQVNPAGQRIYVLLSDVLKLQSEITRLRDSYKAADGNAQGKQFLKGLETAAGMLKLPLLGL